MNLSVVVEYRYQMGRIYGLSTVLFEGCIRSPTWQPGRLPHKTEPERL